MSAQFAIGLAGYLVGVNMLAYGSMVLDEARAGTTRDAFPRRRF